MMRRLSIAVALVSSLGLVATAQPKAPKDGAKGNAQVVPIDPYAPKPAAPDDPYADPAPPAPLPPPPAPPAKPDPKAKGKKAPVDPYAEPVALPPPPPKPDPKAKQKVDFEDPYAPVPPEITPRVAISDLPAVQGLLAVQRVDGWLLYDRDGGNPIAARVVRPEGNPSRPWFYLVRAKGDPIVLAHVSELRSFDHLAGKKLSWTAQKDLDKQLKTMLAGMKTIAAEYSAKAATPSVSRIDAGTLERVRATGVKIRSSEMLVQFTKAIWGEAGRTQHYVAVHHLTELRKDALSFVAKAIQAGQPITEYDVQQRLARGLRIRGLASSAPVVAAGVNTADPYYVPNQTKAATIKRGDLLVISLALKVDKPDGVWAAQTWVAMVDTSVPEPVASTFAAVVEARDRAIASIVERGKKRRPITGAEVDEAARAVLKKAALADKVLHRTGHSIDNDLQGAGADLDGTEVRDTRILAAGTGFTVGPGVYLPGQYGVRSEVSVYLAGSGPVITTPKQDAIEPLLGR